MNTNCRKLLLLLPILFASPANAGVNCDGVPHTRLELTICGEPLLRALDVELTATLEEARHRGIIKRDAVVEQRNRIARQCRRESSDALRTCLLDAELRSLEWVVSKLGQGPVGGASFGSERWRYDASPRASTSQLKRQLKLAESRLRFTGDPELTVLTILNMISLHNDESEPTADNAAVVSQLESQLASGCDHAVYGAKWQAVLGENNISCSDLRSPALFSSTDFIN